jgi:hypothetical protein
VDGLSGGAGEGALGTVGELDGHGVLSDVDGDHRMGMGAAERQLLAGDQNDPGGGGPALHGDRLH